jgi:hypothetical protein
MADFDFPTDEGEPVTTTTRRQQPQTFPFGAHFLSTFLAVLLALLVFGVGVRLYVQWSISDTLNKIEKKQTQTR